MITYEGRTETAMLLLVVLLYGSMGGAFGNEKSRGVFCHVLAIE